MSIMRWRPGHNLDRWDSFGSDIGNLRREMDRLFSHFIVPSFDVGSEESIFPSAELQDKGDMLMLKLEVPGMKPDDLDIRVGDEAVTIKGERQSETKSEENGTTRSEFHYGKFSRTIALPTGIKSEEVVADYKDGVLSLTLPKQEKETSKTVKIEVNS